MTLSHVWLFVTPWTAACQTSLSFTISQRLLRFKSIESVMPSSVATSSFCPQSFPASRSFQVSWLFTLGGQSINSFSFSISPSNGYSGLISFRIDWFDLLTVQGTLKSLLWHHSSKASILWCSAFIMVQLSHLHKTTGKTIALTIWIFVSKVMSLLFNTVSRFVMVFLPRSKSLLLPWPVVTICSDFGA